MPAPVGPTISVWPTSPTCSEKRNGVEPSVLAKNSGGAVEMLVALGPGPDRRKRHHVREIEGRDRRLADIGVDMARQAAEPGFDRVDRLAHAGEVAALDGLLDEPQPLVGGPRILVPDGDGGGDIGFADEVGAELLQRRVGVERLVGGVAVQQHRGLVGHHLLQDRRDRFALGKPLPADAGQHLAASVLSRQIARVDQR